MEATPCQEVGLYNKKARKCAVFLDIPSEKITLAAIGKADWNGG